MEEEAFGQDDISRLINSAWDQANSQLLFLRARYDEKLVELGITSSQAEQNLDLNYRTLNGLLDGSLQRIELVSLLKLGHFLDIPDQEIIQLYAQLISEKHKEDLKEAKKRTFILNNFDLPTLKSMGIIKSIRDFTHIEHQINEMFSLESILDYDTEDTGAALSSTKIKPKNDKTRKLFKNKARLIFRQLNNPNKYDKEAIVEYFPKIRWHSTDIENGLINIVKSLYALGLTIIYQPTMPSLQMRGATFQVNGKPCIVLTDYMQSYPTMWFALLHELFHVMFDWEEILVKRYHLSDEENDLFVLRHKEEEANEFARDFLFPVHKLEIISPRIRQRLLVKEFALDNHVHPSIIYSNYALQNSNKEKNYWAEFAKLIRPNMDGLIQKLGGGLTYRSKAIEFTEHYRCNIFNQYLDE
jgi:Zn-dependent peptidase ImmA (M78 family)